MCFEWHKSVPRPSPKDEVFLSTKFKGIKYWPSQSEKKTIPLYRSHGHLATENVQLCVCLFVHCFGLVSIPPGKASMKEMLVYQPKVKARCMEHPQY